MSDTEQRTTELEVRLAFVENTVQTLDATVAAQDRLLLQLRRDLENLRLELRGIKDTLPGDAQDEPPPPHY
jgi:SlyX protein